MTGSNGIFLNIIRSKGWTLKEVGQRWGGLSERQMSRISSTDDQRDLDSANGLPKRIKVKVGYHTSGRFTLMTKGNGEKMYSDCKDEGLFGNSIPFDFYRKVALKLGALAADGYIIEYKDTPIYFGEG